MVDKDMFNNRHLSEDEAAIKSAIVYLEFHDPENANRNYAIGLLKYMERVAFHIEKQQDLNFDDFLREFKKSEKNSEN